MAHPMERESVALTVTMVRGREMATWDGGQFVEVKGLDLYRDSIGNARAYVDEGSYALVLTADGGSQQRLIEVFSLPKGTTLRDLFPNL